MSYPKYALTLPTGDLIWQQLVFYLSDGYEKSKEQINGKIRINEQNMIKNEKAFIINVGNEKDRLLRFPLSAVDRAVVPNAGY